VEEIAAVVAVEVVAQEAASHSAGIQAAPGALSAEKKDTSPENAPIRYFSLSFKTSLGISLSLV
jgi:hypothetical protein